MGKECTEIQVKGVTQSFDLLFMQFDRAQLTAYSLTPPTGLIFETIVTEKVAGNIVQLISGNQGEFEMCLSCIGMVCSSAPSGKGLVYSNKMMTKFFVVNCHATPFAEFFLKYTEKHPSKLRDLVFNAIVLDFPYIQRKKLLGSEVTVSGSIPADEARNDFSASLDAQESCRKIRDEIYMIDCQIKKEEMEIAFQKQSSSEATKAHSQNVDKLLQSYNQVTEKNKNLERMISKISVQRKTLERQKATYNESLNQLLQKEVQKKLKEYQDTLRAKHREVISHLELTYNFDISQRRLLNEQIAEINDRNDALQMQIDHTQNLVRDIQARERVKQVELLDITREIEDIEAKQQLLRSSDVTQHDILNCKLCGESPATIIFRPCGHLLYCSSCWLDYLTDDKDPSLNHTKYFCLICLEFRQICKVVGFTDRLP